MWFLNLRSKWVSINATFSMWEYFTLEMLLQLFICYEEYNIPWPHSYPGGYEPFVQGHKTLMFDGLQQKFVTKRYNNNNNNNNIRGVPILLIINFLNNPRAHQNYPLFERRLENLTWSIQSILPLYTRTCWFFRCFWFISLVWNERRKKFQSTPWEKYEMLETPGYIMSIELHK